jgi:hypothetical protein
MRSGTRSLRLTILCDPRAGITSWRSIKFGFSSSRAAKDHAKVICWKRIVSSFTINNKLKTSCKCYIVFLILSDYYMCLSRSLPARRSFFVHFCISVTFRK